jgi:hypothetical protein
MREKKKNISQNVILDRKWEVGKKKVFSPELQGISTDYSYFRLIFRVNGWARQRGLSPQIP